MSIVVGQCRLCGNVRELQSSHLSPAAAYKRLRDSSFPGSGNIVVTSESARSTSKQAQKKLLCEECEQRFSNNGERFVVGQCILDGQFPLRERLATAKALFQDQDFFLHDLDAVTSGNSDAFRYFALSMIWRASVTEWKLDGSSLRQGQLGPYEAPIREYLLGKAPIPSSACITVHIAADGDKFNMVVMPGQYRSNTSRAYQFYQNGLLFVVHVGNRIPQHAKDLSITHRTPPLISLGPVASYKLFRNAIQMAKSARRSRSVERFVRESDDKNL